MKASCILLAMGVATAVLGAISAAPESTKKGPFGSSIPYVPTRYDAVQDILWMAGVGKDDVVCDLGSGDGRIVIAAVRDWGARRAVGIEIDPERIRESRQNAERAGVAERVEFIHGDLFKQDFSQANVVALFVGHDPNLKLRPRILRTLQPGTRIVSHQFGMGEWQPDKSLTVRTVALGMWSEQWNPFGENARLPDFTANERRHGSNDRIHMWVVPASFAGVWCGEIETEAGPQNFRLSLHQRLSEVTGSFQLTGQTNLVGRVRVDSWGDHLRFEGHPDNMSYFKLILRFDGRVRGHTMQGLFVVNETGKDRGTKWEAFREEVDFCGTWEWPCATGERKVRLRIERREGGIVATYLDRDKETPISDFYDWGGGFYFTLPIGRGGSEDIGWLIGEGIVENGQIKGRIEFYPEGSMLEREPRKPVARDWVPRLIER